MGRQGELPEDTDDPNRKALATEETQEDPEDGSDRNNSESFHASSPKPRCGPVK